MVFLGQVTIDAAKRKPAELREFLASQHKAAPTPEYSKKFFFLNSTHGLRFEGVRPDKPTGALLTKLLPLGAPRDAIGVHIDLSAKPSDITIEQATIASAILSLRPETKVTIFVPSSVLLLPTQNAFIKSVPGLERYLKSARLAFMVGGHVADVWAQDIGESVRIESGGKQMPALLIPVELRSGRRIPEQLGVSPVKIPLIFEGGDVTTTIISGKKIVIAGQETLESTRNYYEKKGYRISEAEIRDILKRSFGADDTLVLKTGTEKPYLAFHIDQIMFFPKDGIAVMAEPSTDQFKGRLPFGFSEYLSALKEYEQQLNKAGFRIIKIPVRESNVATFQSYTNAVPLTGTDGKSTVILPSFSRPLGEIDGEAERLWDYQGDPLFMYISRRIPGGMPNKRDEVVEILRKWLINEQKGISNTEKQIKEVLERNGIRVIFIRDFGSSRKGNVHCITGAVARMDTEGSLEYRSLDLIPKKRFAT